MSTVAWSTTISPSVRRVISELPWHKYHSLPNETIRLVRVHLSRAHWYGVPICTIETYHQDLCPVYVALSYTWGRPEDALGDTDNESTSVSAKVEYGEAVLYPVVANGQLIGVRRNLFEFLRFVGIQLDDKNASESDLYWIDALCINQADLDERSCQVGLMGSIYHKASQVLVWLGEGNREDMAIVKDIIRRVFKLGEAVDTEAKRIGLFSQITWERRIDQQRFLANANLSSLDNGSWQKFCKFFQRNWFGRLWIIQEIALAKQVKLLCSNQTFNIEELGRCGDILRYGLDTLLARWCNQNSGGSFRPLGQTMHRLCQIRSWFETGVNPFAQQWNWWLLAVWNGTMDTSQLATACNVLLRMSNGAESTEVIDRVYALIGLLKHLAPQQSVPVIVDYSKPETAVRLELWKYILNETNWLNMICLVEHAKDSVQLPSWAPQLSKSKYHKIYSHSHFNASRSLAKTSMVPGLPSLSISDRNELFIGGKRLCKVVLIEEPHGRMVHDIYESIMSFLVSCDCCYEATGESRLTVVWKTKIAWAGGDQPSQDADRLEESFRETLLAAFADFAVVKIIELSSSYSGNNLLDQLRAVLAVEVPNLYAFAAEAPIKEFPLLEKMVEEVLDWKTVGQSSVSGGRIPLQSPLLRMLKGGHIYSSITELFQPSHRLFKTDTGLIGLASNVTEVGDEVWLVPRTTVPIVLRSLDGRLRAQTSVEKDAEASGVARNRDQNAYYMLVGESYVHGVMYGEIIDEWDAAADRRGQSWDWERIVLV